MTVHRISYPAIALNLPGGHLSDEEFYAFCQINPELRIERTAEKDIIVIPPTNSETGNWNFELAAAIAIWNHKTRLGFGFDSSTGFKLPNGAERSPDVAWVARERWEALPPEQRRRFAPIAPDFVAELRSPDQNVAYLKSKMEEYIENGCRLAWLIDPQGRKTWTYTAEGDIQTVSFDEPLAGGTVLPGLSLRLAEVFEAGG